MSNTEIQIGRDYAEAVFARAIRPFEPPGFATNWKDQPSRFKTYLSVERFPLPIDPPSHFASFGDVVARMATPRADLRELTFDDVATMLLFTHGLLNRRIAVSWNRDDRVLSIYPQAVYGRGAASGGGYIPQKYTGPAALAARYCPASITTTPLTTLWSAYSRATSRHASGRRSSIILPPPKPISSCCSRRISGRIRLSTTPSATTSSPRTWASCSTHCAWQRRASIRIFNSSPGFRTKN